MEASVGFLLENLKQLLLSHVIYMEAEAKHELHKLKKELDMLMSILKNVSLKYKKDENFEKWEVHITKVVHDTEDTIDTCLTQMAADKAKKRNQFPRLFKSTSVNLAEVVRQIRKKKVQPLFYNLQKTIIRFTCEDTTVAEAKEITQKGTKKMVSFTKEVEELVQFLNEESVKLEVFSIVGMAGLGKTTLARNIFQYSKILSKFPVRIWVDVTEFPDMEKILHTILKHFTDILPKSLKDLFKMANSYLKDRKFLIVLDNICSTGVWEMIKKVFPSDIRNGKVLVTTRSMDVVNVASTRPPHYMRFLTLAESWELLQYVVYGDLIDVSPELEGFGELIAKCCEGNPLSIVIIGGIILGKRLDAGGNTEAISEAWFEITTRVKSFLVDGDKNTFLSSIISFSFEKISYELRNCFLYLGVFPTGTNIPVKELIWLWIAEGFIQKKDKKSMEQVALENLTSLINRNLVMVKEVKFDGVPKTCHINSSVHDICRKEANFVNQNLFQGITRFNKGFFEPRNDVKKFRRLCIHSCVVDFFKQNNKVPNARSFLSFHLSPILVPPEHIRAVTSVFGILRVYNAKNIKFPILPVRLIQLMHLRYLTLVMEYCSVLPESISELLHLQTLTIDVSSNTFNVRDVSSNTLNVRADIWKMRQLRHLNTKATITLRRDGKGEGGENLQTLSRLSPESCTNEVFKKARNLIRLGIQGELDRHCLSFSDALLNLKGLQKLKLVNQVSKGKMAENPLRRLPESQNFPPNLKILVLSGTYMQWSKMSILSQLQSLKVLKLKDNAFKGDCWDAEYVFNHLESLHLERLSELVHWKADNYPFPELKFLVLITCQKLTQVPDRVCENLVMLHMERVTPAAECSAKEIEKRKQDNRVVFKLEIAAGVKIQYP